MEAHPISTIRADLRLLRLQAIGTGVLRYGLVFLLVLWGGFKFAQFEAEGIKPLIANSPFFAWLYAVFSVRTVSALIGIFELCIGVLIATRAWMPRASGLASLAAAALFVVTLSFLITTPGVLAPTNPAGGFLLKDLLLLGAALFTAAEALLAAEARAASLLNRGPPTPCADASPPA